MSYAKRFKKRKELLENLKKEGLPPLLEGRNQPRVFKPDFELASEIYSRNQEFYSFNPDLNVSEAEVEEFLKRFRDEFNDQHFKNTIEQCKKEVIGIILNPFGLGHLVAAYDKVGGNVDTIHNARKGIYANDEEGDKYKKETEKNDNNNGYDDKEYHQDKQYKSIKARHSADKEAGKSIDYMTGQRIDPNQSQQLDHIVSAHEIHHDRGRVLAELDGKVLANTDYNLAPTDHTLNQSKGKESMEKFIDSKNQRLAQMKQLEAKTNLSPSEQDELKKLKKFQQIDDERALNADRESRKKIDKEINKQYYRSGKFAKNAALAGVSEGAKMGMQQAIGIIMTEFFVLLFDEIADIYKHGFSIDKEQAFLEALKTRIKNIASKLQAKWKELAEQTLKVGAMGFISGFISSLATTLINAFITTSKRAIRIIREGIFSLFKAVKFLLFPPENMTFEEAFHEAKKLIATGLIVSVGVIIESYVDTLTTGIPILADFNLSAILVGALTAFAASLVIYHIDKAKNDKKMIEELIKQTHKDIDQIENLLQTIL